MSTINAPTDWAQVESDWGLSFAFASQEMLLELQDMLDVNEVGVLGLVGDVGGTGTDTLRVRSLGSVGYARTFTTLSSETEVVDPSAITSGYRSVAVSQHALSHEETYFSSALNGGRNWVTLEDLVAQVPRSWIATMRSKVATTVAAFGTNIGSVSTDASVDDLLDLLAAARNGKAIGMRLGGILDPQQVSQLLNSARSEPAFQNATSFTEQQGINQAIVRNFLGLPIDFGMTDDVGQTGGGYDGGFWTPGAVGWAVSSTMPAIANAQGAIYVPQYGLVIEQMLTEQNRRVRRYQASSIFGVAAANTSGPTTHFMRGFLSRVV